MYFNEVAPAPSKLLMFLEPRAILEYSSVLFSKRALSNVPEGKGQPVVVMPGLGTTDASTKVFRDFLEKIGYEAYGWGQGRNIGFKPYKEERLINRLNHLYEHHQEPIHLIGWSLGGIYAREIAKRIPKKIFQVISFGSPFAGGKHQKTNVNWVYKILSGEKIEDVKDKRSEYLHMPPPVPTTSIFSKTDGIVSWQYCRDVVETSTVQNIEVKGSHCGMGFNGKIYYIVADRLAQTDEWIKFDIDRLQHVSNMGLF